MTLVLITGLLILCVFQALRIRKLTSDQVIAAMRLKRVEALSNSWFEASQRNGKELFETLCRFRKVEEARDSALAEVVRLGSLPSPAELGPEGVPYLTEAQPAPDSAVNSEGLAVYEHHGLVFENIELSQTCQKLRAHVKKLHSELALARAKVSARKQKAPRQKRTGKKVA